ncbi:MAG: PhzF family phenazine biosynthesis protein, partial [Cyclobacteriaceae bacterium]|nr:PhzF family phenazine biosynthesis protein [Cyclobacteriaceae bacterium]
YLLVFETESDITSLKPNFPEIKKMPARGVIITAKGDEVDFVSRFFGPQVGIDEDPVTGSAHTTLIPYWAERLNKQELKAVQLSTRRGYLQCRHLGDRVEISGKGKLYLAGEIFIE